MIANKKFRIFNLKNVVPHLCAQMHPDYPQQILIKILSTFSGITYLYTFQNYNSLSYELLFRVCIARTKLVQGVNFRNCISKISQIIFKISKNISKFLKSLKMTFQKFQKNNLIQFPYILIKTQKFWNVSASKYSRFQFYSNTWCLIIGVLKKPAILTIFKRRCMCYTNFHAASSQTTS